MILDKILFGGHLEEGEEVLFTVHRHWSSAYAELFKVAFFGMLAPWGLYAFFPPLFWVSLVWSILGYFKFMYSSLDWYSDAFIFSSESVLKIEWNGFFHRSASRINYLDIEEVTYEIIGFWGTILNFGKFSVSTASNTVFLDSVKNPKKAESVLNKIKTEKSERKKMSDSTKLRDLIANMVASHID